ncbi:NME7_3 [Blepharisma stoltei]|uniref:Nucleoside diphosphate kinase n=1 Tax=Blepharisma stoltei TaxID=1481888 RepID=A0AAU9J9S2_9CILI|nr:unnamed protein product [Blepharisma stoltei]
MAASEDRFVFIVDWFDQPASLIRKYQVTYYCVDNTIEMYDIKNRRIFLKRCQYPTIALTDLFIGATVTIYARQLKVVEYADVFTRTHFESQRGRTFAMIKPDCYSHIGKIVDTIVTAGFRISHMKMAHFTIDDARQFYAEHQGKPFYNELVNFMASDVVVGMELIAENAVPRWRELMGPTNPNTARVDAPRSLRAVFGTEGSHNAVHGSDAPASATREINFFFGLQANPAVLNNCTCCVIKPHAIENAGKIIDMILNEGYEISALQMFSIDKPTAQEFLEVYKGVLPEYVATVDELTSGPLIAMEIRQENVVQSFRQLCGPIDPEVAKNLRPGTIRARFGVNKVQNAVHCTDLPEDGALECEYFFRILSGSN